MVNESLNTKNSEQQQSHKALYHAVSKQLWGIYQKRVFQFWQSERALKSRVVFSKRYYLPLLRLFADKLTKHSTILEIGSGPVCIAQHLEKGKQTYIDPLIDDYRKLFPGVMPEKATYIALMAEKMELPASAFDMVLCLDTLSRSEE
ncbi:MAG: hypothetical protein Q9M44_07700, partial [Ghiorsea sp.]|nr:hypothetical protein [Ghiorsea sp.]